MKIDIGCGVRKQPDHVGVDIRQFEGVDVVLDAGTQVWPWGDNSVDEIFSSHFIEHLTGIQRVHFVNEAYRVLKPGGKLTMICPSASSDRAYGDVTHQWPPVVPFWSLYLNREWRIDQKQALHNDFYSCDFVGQANFGIHPSVIPHHKEYQEFALTFFREAAQDLHFVLFARKESKDASK